MADNSERTLRTGPALKLAGANREIWLNTAGRHLFPHGPSTEPDGVRRFTLDDVICAKIFDELLGMGLTRVFAASIATDIRICLLLDRNIETLSVIRDGDRPAVVLAVPPGVAVLMQFSIAKYRAVLEAPFAQEAS